MTHATEELHDFKKEHPDARAGVISEEEIAALADSPSLSLTAAHFPRYPEHTNLLQIAADYLDDQSLSALVLDLQERASYKACRPEALSLLGLMQAYNRRDITTGVFLDNINSNALPLAEKILSGFVFPGSRNAPQGLEPELTFKKQHGTLVCGPLSFDPATAEHGSILILDAATLTVLFGIADAIADRKIAGLVFLPSDMDHISHIETVLAAQKTSALLGANTDGLHVALDREAGTFTLNGRVLRAGDKVAIGLEGQGLAPVDSNTYIAP